MPDGPEAENPFAVFPGVLAGPGPTSDALRDEMRAEEAEAELRHVDVWGARPR